MTDFADLTQLANQYQTDKGTLFAARHAYTIVYDVLLHSLRDRDVRLMEIGLNIGGPEMGFDKDRAVADAPSLRMWLDYFPTGVVHGLDISDFSRYQSDRFKFHRADCGDRSALASVARTSGSFNFILDDGSHASYHQQLTLLTLFGNVRTGGYYIIEDLDWQPEAYEKALPAVPKTARVLHDFLETGALPDTGAFDHAAWLRVMNEVGAIFLFDQRTLTVMRRAYNRRAGIGATEAPLDRLRPLSFGHLSGVARKVVETARSLSGDVSAVRRPHHKLAILYKR